jgi:hypothetical protein
MKSAEDRVPRPARTFGPAVREPPVLADPRRWGALIGIAGGLAFIFSYSPSLGLAASLGSTITGIGLAGVVLFTIYVRPTSLGPFREPSRMALGVYVGCVVGELTAIGAGSRLLTSLGQAELRPALISSVVGIHFLPFAWAFHERMFRRLGLALSGLGAGGLIAGFAGVSGAAEGAAVLGGLVMLTLLALYALGYFAHRSGS